MSTPQLTAEQRKRIHGYVSSFREYLNSPEGKRDTQDRVYRRQFFQSFTPEKLAKLEETVRCAPRTEPPGVLRVEGRTKGSSAQGGAR